MPLKFVHVHHAKLGATVEVPESAVPHMEEQGWRLVEPETSTTSLYAAVQSEPAPDEGSESQSDRRPARRNVKE